MYFPSDSPLRFGTTAKGDVAEQAVVLALMAAGKTVLKPISNGLRYDLVIDDLDGSFTRVQCKTGILKRGHRTHLRGVQRGRAAAGRSVVSGAG